MRTNLENPRIFEARLTGLRHSNVVAVITGTFVVPPDGPSVFVLDGGAGDRTVRLPALQYDKQVVVANVGATNNLNVTDSSGAALISVPPQAMAVFFAGTTRWVWTTDSFSSDVVTTTVMVGSGAIATTDTEVQVNSPGVAVLTLPSSLTWATVSGWRGLPLSIFDISGAASANNITINPSGGQTISGLASLTIAQDYGGWRLRPKSGGGWVVI